MSDFATHAVIVLTILCLLAASSSLIITAWRTGGLKHDILMMKRRVRTIVRQIRKDINIAIHH